MAEFLLYGRTDYREVLDFAASLRESGERIGSARAVAFAATVAGEAHLLSGDLDNALTQLGEGVDLHNQIGANAGESLSLQRLAEVHLEMGDNEEALRLLDAALPLARWSQLSHHLIQRIYGTMIRATTDRDAARAMVDRANEAIGPSDACRFCTVMIAVPSSIACSAVGDIEAAEQHLAMAERSAAAWQGTAWPAAVAEAKAHLALAKDDRDEAAHLFDEAAELFGRAGQPLDVRRCQGGIPERRLATVLFSDLVESTARAAAAGDAAWRELLDRHDELSRQTFARHGGNEVKFTGDGFLVTFDGPAQAIRCGHELCRRMAELNIQVRVGVHAGEVEVRGDDVGGISVHIGARVMGQAEPGQVMVSSTVPPLVAGSELEFESVGARALKGVPGEWELFRSLL